MGAVYPLPGKEEEGAEYTFLSLSLFSVVLTIELCCVQEGMGWELSTHSLGRRRREQSTLSSHSLSSVVLTIELCCVQEGMGWRSCLPTPWGGAEDAFLSLSLLCGIDY